MEQINTVFYFEPRQLVYDANWNAGKINSRTIVFVADTGAIYRGGRMYGSMSKNDIKEIIKEIYNDDPSDFPSIEAIEEIINQIEALRQDHLDRINALASRISDIRKWERDDIEKISQDVIKDYKWLKDYIENNPSTKVLKITDFEDQANDWALGYIIPSLDGQGGLTFSSLLASHKELLARVAEIKPGVTDDKGNEITYESLVAHFNAWLEASEEFQGIETALAQMKALWSETDADTITVLKWMAASFRVGANPNMTFAEMIASMSGGTDPSDPQALAGVIARITRAEGKIEVLTNMFSEIDGRLSGIESWTNKLANGNYVAGVDLDAKVGDLLNRVSSGVHIKVDEMAKTACAQMISEVATTDANGNTSVTATSIVDAITSDTEAAASLSAYYARQDNDGLNDSQVRAVVHEEVKASINAASWEVYCQYISGMMTSYSEISSVLQEGIVTNSMIASITDSNGNVSTTKIVQSITEDSSLIQMIADQVILSGDYLTLQNGQLQLTSPNSGPTIKVVDDQYRGSTTIFSDHVVLDYRDDATWRTDVSSNYIKATASKFGDEGDRGSYLLSVNGLDMFDEPLQADSYFITGNEPISGNRAHIGTDGFSFDRIQNGQYDSYLTYNTNSGDLNIAGDIIANDIDVANLNVYNELSIVQPKIYLRKGGANSSITYEPVEGITKTVKIGDYYMMFLKGILVYCDTTNPADTTNNNPFIDPNQYPSENLDLTAVDMTPSDEVAPDPEIQPA